MSMDIATALAIVDMPVPVRAKKQTIGERVRSWVRALRMTPGNCGIQLSIAHRHFCAYSAPLQSIWFCHHLRRMGIHTLEHSGDRYLLINRRSALLLAEYAEST